VPVGLEREVRVLVVPGHDAEVGAAFGDRDDDVLAHVFLQRYAHARVGAQIGAEVVGQEGGDRARVGEQAHLRGHALGVGREVGVHLLEFGEAAPAVLEHRTTGRGERHAARLAPEQRRPERFLELADAQARRRRREVAARRAARNVAGVGDRDDELQVDEAVAQGFVRGETGIRSFTLVRQYARCETSPRRTRTHHPRAAPTRCLAPGSRKPSTASGATSSARPTRT